MKTLEKIVLKKLLPQVKPYMDNLQFAYSAGLGVDDAVLTLLHTLHNHLDKLGTKARLLFVDFSSAFNTIQPHLLMTKLKNMNVNSNLILWIQNFLTNRLQYVNCNGTKSESKLILVPHNDVFFLCVTAFYFYLDFGFYFYFFSFFIFIN